MFLASSARLGFAIVRVIDGELMLFFGYYNTRKVKSVKVRGLLRSYNEHGVLWHTAPLPVMIPSSFVDLADLSPTVIEALPKPPITFKDVAKITKGQMEGLGGAHRIEALLRLLDKKFRPKVRNAQAKLEKAMSSNQAHQIVAQFRTDLKNAQSDLEDASMWMVEFFNRGT
jgi:hypothetical protein